MENKTEGHSTRPGRGVTYRDLAKMNNEQYKEWLKKRAIRGPIIPKASVDKTLSDHEQYLITQGISLPSKTIPYKDKEIPNNWDKLSSEGDKAAMEPDHIKYSIELVVTRIDCTMPSNLDDRLQRFNFLTEYRTRAEAYDYADKIALMAKKSEKNSAAEKGVFEKFFKWRDKQKTKTSSWPKESPDGNSLRFEDGSEIVLGKIPSPPQPEPPGPDSSGLRTGPRKDPRKDSGADLDLDSYLNR